MKITFTVWVLTVTVHIGDLDVAKGSIDIGVTISWK